MRNVYKTLVKEKGFVKKTLTNNKTYLLLLGLNIISAACSILIYKFTTFKFTDDEVFLFTFLKRAISFLSPISLMGLGVTLTRYVGKKEEESILYFIISFVLVLFLPLIVFVSFYFYPDFTTKLIFGENLESYKSIVIPMILNLLGLNFASIIISFHRGKGEFLLATSLSLVLVILMPFLLLLLPLSFSEYIGVFGIFLIVVCSTYGIKVILRYKIYNLSYGSFIKEGVGRMFGDIGYYFLLFAPSYFLLQIGNELNNAAALAFCQVLINSCSILVNPISFVALTKTVNSVKNKEIDKLKRKFNKTVIWVFFIFILVMLFFLGTLEFLVKTFFTKSILSVLSEVKVFLTVLPFFGVYLSGRSFLDGATSKPIMSYINIVGLALFLVIMFVLKMQYSLFLSINISFILSFVVMDLMIILFMNFRKWD